MKSAALTSVMLSIHLFLFPSAHAEPVIEIGSGFVENGTGVEIPILFNNRDDVIGIQFDVVFEPSFFDDVDTSHCLGQISDGGFLAACSRLDWPNRDIVRFVIVSLERQPLPSGQLGHLTFNANPDAESSVVPLDGLSCTGLAIGSELEEIPLTPGDYQAGEIVITGLEPSDPPEPQPANLDLDGELIAGEDPIFRRLLRIENPISILAVGANEMVLTLPGGTQLVATKKQFVPRQG